jgi:hypothetical protein
VTDGVVEQEPKPCPTLGRLLIVHPRGQAYACYASEYLELTPLANMRDTLLHRVVQRIGKARRPVNACRSCPEPHQGSRPLPRATG